MDKAILRIKRGNNNKNFRDYDHYIALDWSQDNVALARSTNKQTTPKVHDFASDLKAIKDYLIGLRGHILLTIEETTTSHWLYVELLDCVDRIIICDPYRNRLLSDGPKTDKIDAKKLCQLLRGGFLKEVYHSCDTDFRLRHLVSAYEDLVKSGVRSQNQRHAVYRAQGYRYTKKNGSALKDRISDEQSMSFISDWQDRCVDRYLEDKASFEAHIERVIKGNKIINNLRSLPGIGAISALKIHATVIQAQRFSSKGHYLSYCGLVMHEKTSGNRSYGKRNPRFNGRLKSVYKMAAHRAILLKNNPVYEYYEELIEKGLTIKQAKLMAARYLAKVSLGIMKNGQKYEPYRWRENNTVA
jgi:transposase